MRARTVIGLIVLGTLAALLVLRGGTMVPPWHLTVATSADKVSPWRAINLRALIDIDASSKRWHYEWKANGGKLEIDGDRAIWRAGVAGTYKIVATVRAPDGTIKTAAVELSVGALPYLSFTRGGLRELPADDTPFLQSNQPTLPFGIDEVVVEKDQICRGASTKIRVASSHDDPAETNWLLTMVGAGLGPEQYFHAGSRKPGMYRVPIWVASRKGNQRVMSAVFVEVLDCAADLYMAVTDTQSTANTAPEARDLKVIVRPGKKWFDWLGTRWDSGTVPPQPTAEVDHYIWHFGDGTRARTSEPSASHVFPPEHKRSADRRHAFYQVTVEARDASDSVIGVGHGVVAMKNYLRALEHDSKRLQLSVRYHPHPQQDERDRKFIDVELTNVSASETAQLLDLKYTSVPCDKTKSRREHTGPATSVFDSITIEPGQRVRGRLVWKAGDDETCLALISLQGTSTSGYPVQGEFRMQVNRRNARTITDPVIASRLLKAQRLIGKNYLTDDDILRLEREGKLPAGTLEAKRTALR